jgi:predicted dehydrogenase
MEVVGTAQYERLPFVWAEQGEKVVLDGIAAELDAFAAAVRGAPMAGPGGADAVAALEVAERVNRCLR